MSSPREAGDRLLVIACGNPLRSDDGVAWRVAEEIRKELRFAKILCVHQLTPELAEEVSHADAVIFIDANRNGQPGTVLCEAIPLDSTAARFSHHLAPAQVLALCSQLYGAEPRGFLLSIRGECFDHGEALSPAVMEALPSSVAKAKELVKRIGISF